MLKRVVCVALVGAASGAWAADYDIKAYCKQVAQVGGGGSYMIEKSCRDMEAGAKQRVAARQSKVPTQVLAYCDQVATVGGGGSYSMLESCINMELQAKRSLD